MPNGKCLRYTAVFSINTDTLSIPGSGERACLGAHFERPERTVCDDQRRSVLQLTSFDEHIPTRLGLIPGK